MSDKGPLSNLSPYELLAQMSFVVMPREDEMPAWPTYRYLNTQTVNTDTNETEDFYECLECGAIIINQTRHNQDHGNRNLFWHEIMDAFFGLAEHIQYAKGLD